jgi:glyoxylase-like metal-dependent hydrolase (beta-lactamase superfamily II)
MKRALLLIAAVVLLLLLGVAGLYADVAAGTAPLREGAVLPGGTRVVKDGIVSVALLEAGPGRVALVDCGNDAEAAPVKAALAERGLTPESVVAVFLTHGHQDHVAGCAAFPRAEFFALAAEQPILEGQAPKSPIGKVAGGQAAPVKVTRLLRDGEAVQVGALSVQAYALPGHTPGSAAYLAAGTLFLGDSATSTGDGKVKGAPWVFSEDLALNHASLRALPGKLGARKGEVQALAFAHSGPLQGVGPLEAFAAEGK